MMIQFGMQIFIIFDFNLILTSQPANSGIQIFV